MKKFLSHWGPALLLAGLIYIYSAIPTPVKIPSGWDKALHFLEFGLLGFLTTRAVFLSKNLGRGLGIFWGALLASIWGILDEMHQFFVPGRNPSVGDTVADVLGAVSGAVLFIYLGLFLYKSEKLYPRRGCKT